MTAPVRREDPGQDDLREWFLRLGSQARLPLYTSLDEDGINCGTFCGLAPTSYREEALRDPGWDLMHGPHGPGFSQEWDGDGAETTRYFRTSSDPVEPLVIDREFYGIRPAYKELSEEFRLFHNLYNDVATGDLRKFDDAGNDEVAAQIQPDQAWALTSLVRRYQAARQLDLLLFIDCVVYYDASLPSPGEQAWVAADRNAVLHVGDLGGRPFSRFLATRVLPPPPIDRSGVWPFEGPLVDYPEFIIGSDEHGDPVRFTSDPGKLSNYFGANPGAPNYLTPVHFRRDVLVKYYDRPDMYTVEDGYLRCRALWGLQMDNDTSDTVMVWLGDLGRDLPASERDYWRAFNVPPTAGISDTAYRRAILGQFADAQSTDLRFHVAYRRLGDAWRERFGWPLFRDPEPGDAHLLDAVRRPLHDTDTEFEDLVRTLAKLLVDSLNEAEITRTLPPGPTDEKGISKLERWLNQAAYANADRDIKFLRDLQSVRSKGAAHRKGSDYEKALERALGAKRRAAAGNELLERSLPLLQDLATFAATPTGEPIVAP
jgi:hypothetical protein